MAGRYSVLQPPSERTRMRVFITGGNGYIGQAVVEALVAEGHDVEALVGEGTDTSVVSDIGAEPRLGHLCELDLLRAAGYLGVGESDVTMRQVAEAASRAAGAGGATRS